MENREVRSGRHVDGALHLLDAGGDACALADALRGAQLATRSLLDARLRQLKNARSLSLSLSLSILFICFLIVLSLSLSLSLSVSVPFCVEDVEIFF